MRPVLYVVDGGSHAPRRSVGEIAVGTEPCAETKSIGPVTLSPMSVNPAGFSVSAAHVAVAEP